MPLLAPLGELYAVVPPVAIARVVVVAANTGWWYAIPLDTIVSTYALDAASVLRFG